MTLCTAALIPSRSRLVSKCTSCTCNKGFTIPTLSDWIVNTVNFWWIFTQSCYGCNNRLNIRWYCGLPTDNWILRQRNGCPSKTRRLTRLCNYELGKWQMIIELIADSFIFLGLYRQSYSLWRSRTSVTSSFALYFFGSLLCIYKRKG